MTPWVVYTVSRYKDGKFDGSFGVNKFIYNNKCKTARKFDIKFEGDDYWPDYNSYHSFSGLEFRGKKIKIAIRHIKPPAKDCYDFPHRVIISFIFEKDPNESFSSYEKESSRFAKKVFKKYIDQYNQKHKIKFTYNLIPYKEVNGKIRRDDSLIFK